MELLKRIYNALTAPLYRRLLYELQSGIQAQLQSQLDSQEALLTQILDELSSINLQLDEFRESPSDMQGYLKQRNHKLTEIENQLSSETIHSILKGLKKKRGLQAVMEKYEISASDVVRLDSKYHGMNAFSIERVRQLAKQSQSLEDELRRMQAFTAVEITSAPQVEITGTPRVETTSAPR